MPWQSVAVWARGSAGSVGWAVCQCQVPPALCSQSPTGIQKRDGRGHSASSRGCLRLFGCGHTVSQAFIFQEISRIERVLQGETPVAGEGLMGWPSAVVITQLQRPTDGEGTQRLVWGKRSPTVLRAREKTQRENGLRRQQAGSEQI